ncbi:hypothetical protein [Streptomyces sp. SPB78]|uniref:Uncharacterized protein n=1 Tax=Streptomyces phage SF3 TaxID=1690818 RepID=A0A0M4R9M3_9CAUD|nr:hypothetical protein [Streptomyces sp. SPB78]YP_009213195.1 hypothetical protein AVV12_gp68 [Streptomyces phage SF3]ALF00199.1 hypothetical protein SF3_680 [Streptomyces phage SF3]
MTTALVNTDGRIWSTTHSGAVFHAFRLDGDGKPVALCRKNVRPRSHTTIHGSWSTAEFADSTVGGRCERCVAKLDELTAAAAAVADRRQHLSDSRPATAYPLAVANVRQFVREMPRAGALRVRVTEGGPDAILSRDDLHALAYSGHTTAEAAARVRTAVDAHIRYGERDVHLMFPAVGMRPALYLADVTALLNRWEITQPEQTVEEPAAEPVVFLVEIDRHVQARQRVYEDRYRIFQRDLADPIDGFAVPYRGDRNDRTTLAFRGWQIVGDIEYVAGLNVSRARVERMPVEYGNSGHWISAHVVDPDAPRPDEHRYVAVAKCGAHLIETCDTPRGHALCVACTGDPVEVNYLRDREGWMKDGGRPVKVLRALSYHDRIIASTVTTDAKGAAREWHDVRCDATAPEIILAPEEPATREEIAAGALVEAVVISNRPTVQQWRVDRQPWGDERSTILSNGRGVDAVYTASLRIVEQPEPAAAPRREGLRDMCLNALCTKDYGHTRRDGDECGDVFSAAGGGGPRPTPDA